MSDSTAASPKIVDGELLAALRADTPERYSVLVALDVPTPRIAVRQADYVSSRGRMFAGVGGVAARPAAEERLIDERAAKLGQLIQSVTGEDPNYLHGSHAFVTKVTGSQLRVLADSPLVRQIRVNRKLR